MSLGRSAIPLPVLRYSSAGLAPPVIECADGAISGRRTVGTLSGRTTSGVISGTPTDGAVTGRRTIGTLSGITVEGEIRGC